MPRAPAAKRKLALALCLPVALLVANNVALRTGSDPIAAVRAQAVELRGETGELVLLGAGSSTSLLGLRAHGRFRVGGTDRQRVLELELSRRVAGLPWKLERFHEAPADR